MRIISHDLTFVLLRNELRIVSIVNVLNIYRSPYTNVIIPVLFGGGGENMCVEVDEDEEEDEEEEEEEQRVKRAR